MPNTFFFFFLVRGTVINPSLNPVFDKLNRLSFLNLSLQGIVT